MNEPFARTFFRELKEHSVELTVFESLLFFSLIDVAYVTS